jgi:hypothetical protein
MKLHTTSKIAMEIKKQVFESEITPGTLPR